MFQPTLIRSKITPPTPSSRLYVRPRVQTALQAALEHRLTLVQAGAGCGKSTALLHLAQAHRPTAWYQTTREDADPLVFLLHLTHSLQRACPKLKSLPLPLLELWDISRGPFPTEEAVNRLLNALQDLNTPCLIILDDIHRALA